jgi:hypothetical protein
MPENTTFNIGIMNAFQARYVIEHLAFLLVKEAPSRLAELLAVEADMGINLADVQSPEDLANQQALIRIIDEAFRCWGERPAEAPAS